MESLPLLFCLFSISAAVVIPCDNAIDCLPSISSSGLSLRTIPAAVLADSASQSTVRNSVATYKVLLDNCGPRSKPAPAINAPAVSSKPIEASPVTLPYRVPRPRTVSNRCRCVKTILKPQVVRQEIVVPVVRKYVQTLARPDYEVINYNAVPINCPWIESYGPCDF